MLRERFTLPCTLAGNFTHTSNIDCCAKFEFFCMSYNLHCDSVPSRLHWRFTTPSTSPCHDRSIFKAHGCAVKAWGQRENFPDRDWQIHYRDIAIDINSTTASGIVPSLIRILSVFAFWDICDWSLSGVWRRVERGERRYPCQCQ